MIFKLMVHVLNKKIQGYIYMRITWDTLRSNYTNFRL